MNGAESAAALHEVWRGQAIPEGGLAERLFRRDGAHAVSEALGQLEGSGERNPGLLVVTSSSGAERSRQKFVQSSGWS